MYCEIKKSNGNIRKFHQAINSNLDFFSMHVIDQMFPAFKDYSFVQKHVRCYYTIFAYIISVLQDMRFVTRELVCLSWFCLIFLLHFCTISFIECFNSHNLFLQELLQLGAADISPDNPVLSADDLADQIVEVLNYFG